MRPPATRQLLVYIAALLAALLLAGCTAPATRGSRLLPWNWFAPDHATQLEKSEAKTARAETTAVKSAQIENAKTIEALKTAPSGDRSVQIATRTSANAQLLLDNAVGSISAEAALELRATVADLISENSTLRAQGESAQARAEHTLAQQSAALDALRVTNDAITDKLKASDLRYQAAAASARKWKFWIFAIIGGWFLLQILSGAAKFFPALAPLSRVAGMVSAPVLQAVNNKLHTGIGTAIAAAQKQSASLADQLRDFLDKPLDDDNKAAIRATVERLT